MPEVTQTFGTLRLEIPLSWPTWYGSLTLASKVGSPEPHTSVVFDQV